MALATFSLFYNNYDLFQKRGSKIRRGLAVKLILNCKDLESVKAIYFEYATAINNRARDGLGLNPVDKSFEPISIACANVFSVYVDCSLDSSS